MRALIVREPWLSYIPDGPKTWEIRMQDTKVRGVIGLGRNGRMYGEAVLKDSFSMRVKDLAKHQDKHKLPLDCLKDYADGRKALFVWVLKKAEKLKTPVVIPRSYGTCSSRIRIESALLREKKEICGLLRLFDLHCPLEVFHCSCYLSYDSVDSAA